MKNKILLTVALLALAVSAGAALPTYKSASASGNAAAPATVYFPFDPNSQVRVLYVNYSTDTNNSALTFASGSTAYWQTATNQATSSVTNQISGTNGLSVGATLVLQHGGKCYANTVATWNQTTNSGPYGGTNVVLNSGGWGIAAAAGDEIELMGSSATIPAPAASSGSTTTAAATGDAIFVGNYGRLVSLSLTPAFATNKINSASAHYDQVGQ